MRKERLASANDQEASSINGPRSWPGLGAVARRPVRSTGQEAASVNGQEAASVDS